MSRNLLKKIMAKLVCLSKTKIQAAEWGRPEKAFFKKSKSLTKSPLHLGYVKFFCQEVLISFWFLRDTKRFDLIYGTIILRKKQISILKICVIHPFSFFIQEHSLDVGLAISNKAFSEKISKSSSPPHHKNLESNLSANFEYILHEDRFPFCYLQF